MGGAQSTCGLCTSGCTIVLVTKTCTVVVGAQGERCGAEAVVELAGGRFAECAEHTLITPERPLFEKGALVSVRKYGRVYEGKVLAVGRTRALVTFKLAGGSAKTLYFPIKEVLL